jgi:catechol 2,3-dioxygenase
MKLGHVHLKVRDLDRALAFYRDLLGLRVTERLGDDMVFLSFGEAHHDVALQAVGPGAPALAPNGVGLYHSAFAVDTEDELRGFAKKFADAGIRAAGVDHGISHAIYLSDPDGNGVELYRDTRTEQNSPQWSGRSTRLKL